MTTFDHRSGAPVARPKWRTVGDQKFYFASDEELANPEWVSKFTLNNPGVKIVSNKPTKVSRG